MPEDGIKCIMKLLEGDAMILVEKAPPVRRLIFGRKRGSCQASSAENWDFVVAQLTKKLPFMSRHALQFMNSVLTKDLKAKMFNSMIEEYKAQRKRENMPIE